MFSILHIEQSELIKEMVKSEFLGAHIDYIPVSRVDEAYYYINNEKLDLIITSIMTNGDSIENFIHRINSSINKDTPLFIVTSSEISEAKKSILNLGVSDYILKENLISEISKHIEIIQKDSDLSTYLKKSNIAVIDDSKLDQLVLKDILEKHELNNIDFFSKGSDALNSPKSYNIYFVDAVLKNEYGKSLIMQLRRNNPYSTILIVSSLSNSKTIASFLFAGADDFITKPVDECLLTAKLKSNIRYYALLNKQGSCTRGEF